jgi:hypothetical protein
MVCEGAEQKGHAVAIEGAANKAKATNTELTADKRRILHAP